jgi:GxxExxY protein
MKSRSLTTEDAEEKSLTYSKNAVNSMARAYPKEFPLRGIKFDRQKEINLKYKGKEIGKHRVDFLVENKVVLELKAVETMNRIYDAQILT